MIITDYIAIHPHGIGVSDEAGLWDDCFIPSLQDLTVTIHSNSDTRIFAQLHHSGAMCVEKTTGVKPKGPSAIAASNYKERVYAYTNEEIYQLIEDYGNAALRAKKAGFDGVELQACHGYLGAQFLSKHFNKRNDEFGGSYKNRFRFIDYALHNIRKKCGDEFPVIIRLSTEEFLEDGNHVNDACIYAKMAEDAGFDAINVSTGTGIGGNIVTPHYYEPGFNINNVKQIKDGVSIPVIAVGRMNDPVLALSIIEQQRADMVALGRQSLCDAEFPKKVKEDREDEIFHCTGCMQRCYYSKGCEEEDTGVSCMLNPFSGKEGRWTIKQTNTPNKIAIIGAGPAGLEAGWLLAKRGHDVHIYEKEALPGGNFRLAAIPPHKQDIANAIFTLTTLCKANGATIHYNTEISKEQMNDLDASIIIVATGAKPFIPNIPGIKEHQRLATAKEILNGETVIADQNVLILGGGIVGCELAEFLNTYHNKTTIVDMADALAKEQVKRSRAVLMQRLEEAGTKSYCSTAIKQVTETGIIAEQNGKEICIENFDRIVVALGYRNNNPFNDVMTDKTIYTIGDALKARDAKYAIYEAAKLGLTI